MRKSPSQCSDVGLLTVLCIEVVGRVALDAAASGGVSSSVYGPSSRTLSVVRLRLEILTFEYCSQT